MKKNLLGPMKISKFYSRKLNQMFEISFDFVNWYNFENQPCGVFLMPQKLKNLMMSPSEPTSKFTINNVYENFRTVSHSIKRMNNTYFK